MAIVHIKARFSARDIWLIEWDRPDYRNRARGWGNGSRESFARNFWVNLRRVFPVCYAVTLMGNHLHLVVEVDDVLAAWERFYRILGALVRGFGRRTWEAVPTFGPIPDAEEFSIAVRYVLLNPCRAYIVDDPVLWLWSSYRDVIGAVPDPWVSRKDLARLMGKSDTEFLPWFHRYVTAYERTSREGTPMPVAAQPCVQIQYSLQKIQHASAAALRQDPLEIHRRGKTRDLFLALANQQGWKDTSALADHCQISRRSVQRNTGVRVSAEELRAASLCLGDDRLIDAFLTHKRRAS